MKINPNEIKTRDPFMMMIIGGVTKANVEVDQKKEKNKKKCRVKVDRNFED
jgi:hypothetical protein